MGDWLGQTQPSVLLLARARGRRTHHWPSIGAQRALRPVKIKAAAGRQGLTQPSDSTQDQGRPGNAGNTETLVEQECATKAAVTGSISVATTAELPGGRPQTE